MQYWRSGNATAHPQSFLCIVHLYMPLSDSLVWEQCAISGPPPPARLDHAMCAIRLPIELPKPVEASESRTTADDSERQDTVNACETRTLNKDISISCTSFQAVTIVDPESSSSLPSTSSVEQDSGGSMRKGVNTASSATVGVQDGGGGEVEWIPALFVFGGMDTLGNVHGDSFILVP